MRKALPLLLVAAAACGACTMIGKQKPLDEFAVARNAPLIIPPDFALTPPTAGTVAPGAETVQQQAIEALFGGTAPRSLTEMSLLETAGRDRAALGARSLAGDPDTKVVDQGTQTVAILNAPEGNGQDSTAQPPQ